MTTQEQGKEALQAEASELGADIKEAQQEAQQARDAGNDVRADRLEVSIAKTQSDLDEIKATLKAMAERPFAPAPGDGEAAPDAQGRTGDGAAEKEAAPDAAPAADTKPKRGHWLYGQRWNQD